MIQRRCYPILFAEQILEHVWTPFGTVLDASESYEQSQCQEPSVIYEDNTWKMWYSGGVANRNICYATSTDGLDWTKYASNPVVADHTRAHVMKVGATYVMFAIGPGGMSKLTSNDGIAWTVAATEVINNGAGGSWDSGGAQNVFVWVEGETWYMLYEAGDGDNYQIGLATSSNSGETFTKHPSNPVIPDAVGSVSHPWVLKVGSTYYAWVHVAATATLPTDCAKYHSTDLVNWTRSPAGLALPRTSRDEGCDSGSGQVADVHLLEVNGATRIYYTGMVNGAQATGHINMAEAPYPLATVARSNDGIAVGYYGNMLLNAGFERVGVGGADVFASWTESASNGAIAKTAVAGELYFGTGSLKVTAGAAKDTHVIQSVPLASLVVGATYRVTGWARGDGTNAGRIRVYRGGDLIPFAALSNVSTNYQQFATPTFVYPGVGSLSIYCYCPDAAGGVAYFDNLALRRVA